MENLSGNNRSLETAEWQAEKYHHPCPPRKRRVIANAGGRQTRAARYGAPDGDCERGVRA
jgi:hypothetical protein